MNPEKFEPTLPPPEGESERKITTPEEAEEMTRQRREDLGLERERSLTPEETEEIEAGVEGLLERLDSYDFESFGPEIQDEWYWVEQEANVGKDKELAKANLERFLKRLEKES